MRLLSPELLSSPNVSLLSFASSGGAGKLLCWCLRTDVPLGTEAERVATACPCGCPGGNFASFFDKLMLPNFGEFECTELVVVRLVPTEDGIMRE